MVARALGAAVARSLLYLAEISLFVIGLAVILEEAVFAPECSQYRCPAGPDPCPRIQLLCIPRSMGERLGYAAVGTALIVLAVLAVRATWRGRHRGLALSVPPATPVRA